MNNVVRNQIQSDRLWIDCQAFNCLDCLFDEYEKKGRLKSNQHRNRYLIQWCALSIELELDQIARQWIYQRYMNVRKKYRRGGIIFGWWIESNRIETISSLCFAVRFESTNQLWWILLTLYNGIFFFWNYSQV